MQLKVTTKMTTDSTKFNIGTTLRQKYENDSHPIAFKSRWCTTAEQNYCHLESHLGGEKPCFVGMKFQLVQLGQISSYMGKSIFIPARPNRFPPGICLQKPIDFHWFINVHKMMKFYRYMFTFFLQIDVICIVKIQ